MIKSDWFGVPAEAVSGIPSVRLLGKEITEVMNHKGLKSCGEEEICIHTKIGILSVSGAMLSIKEINPAGIRIEGRIEKICYVG